MAQSLRKSLVVLFREVDPDFEWDDDADLSELWTSEVWDATIQPGIVDILEIEIDLSSWQDWTLCDLMSVIRSAI